MQKIYFIGIGGSGMSALAALLYDQGNMVTGSDAQENLFVQNLRQKGIVVKIGHNETNIEPDIERIVYSPAISPDNPERQAANKKGIPQFSYPEAVGELTSQFTMISICGTHGKTTTTSMASVAFMAAGQDPSVIVGARVPELNHNNYRLGKGKWLILESCEYQRSFLHYQPKVIIITTVEVDHLDYYHDRDDYLKAFVQFLEKLPQDGLIIANIDDAAVVEVVTRYRKVNSVVRVVWYGTKNEADYSYKVAVNGEVGIYKKDEYLTNLHLAIPGMHNVMNALAVIALCHTYNLQLPPVIDALSQFGGAERRFQLVGYTYGADRQIPVIDDYGHHPTEIAVTLKAAREKFGIKAKILCIFQPHQHSRTQALLEDFRQCFQYADTVIVPNIYAARDTAAMKEAMPVEKFVEEISKIHPDVRYGHGLDATIVVVKDISSDYDVILTMGAGDVGSIAKALIGV